MKKMKKKIQKHINKNKEDKGEEDEDRNIRRGRR